MLLQVVLCAYAHGVVSSRGIEHLCREHVTFIVLARAGSPTCRSHQLDVQDSCEHCQPSRFSRIVADGVAELA
jgi:hypothetical protein